MGDIPQSVTNAILQATAALNNATRVAERQQESIERLARGVEEGNVQHLTFSVETRTAIAAHAQAAEEQAKQIAVLASTVQSLVTQVVEAKVQAGRAADESRSMRLPEPNSPRHARGSEDSNKTPVGVVRKAWRDLLYAPGRGQIVALFVVLIAALTFLGYLAIKNNIRVAEMEHAGSEIKQKLKGP